MFIDSKYTKWYYSIIQSAKSKSRKKTNRKDPLFEYYEEHHIIPKSIGGNNDKINLVLLTAREHYICHLLLTKMCVCKNHIRKMVRAFQYFNSNKSWSHLQKYNSKLYEYHKKSHFKIFSQIMSERMTKERRKEYSDRIKDSSWVFSPTTNEESLVLNSKVSEYLSKGYILGRNPENISALHNKRRSYVGSGNPRFGTKNEKLSERNKKLKYWVYNDSHSKLILREDLQKYQDLGYSKGRKV